MAKKDTERKPCFQFIQLQHKKSNKETIFYDSEVAKLKHRLQEVVIEKLT